MKPALRVLVAPGPNSPATDSADIQWHPQPIDERKWTEFELIITNPEVETSGWPGKRGMGTSFIGRLNLADGRTAWLTALYVEPWPPAEEMIRIFRSAWLKPPGDPPDYVYDAEMRFLIVGKSDDGSMVVR